jgi:predicted transcriptional regulator
MTDTDLTEMLALFKAVADANRLRIIALLAREPSSVEHLAGQLGLSSSTVSHHLAKLAKVGLVSSRNEGYYSIYRFEPAALTAMAQRLLAKPPLSGAQPAPAGAAPPEVDAYDRKVLKNWLDADGRIRAFPVQWKKQVAILRHVVQAFEPGRRYAEKDLNATLKRFSADTARLRRSLVEAGLMAREGGGGAYWRIDDSPASATR